MHYHKHIAQLIDSLHGQILNNPGGMIAEFYEPASIDENSTHQFDLALALASEVCPIWRNVSECAFIAKKGEGCTAVATYADSPTTAVASGKNDPLVCKLIDGICHDIGYDTFKINIEGFCFSIDWNLDGEQEGNTYFLSPDKKAHSCDKAWQAIAESVSYFTFGLVE